MSGIYIPGMEMPIRCSECDFCTYGWCGLMKRYAMDSAIRDDSCPLVPVPPHGRLIDADALIKNHFSDEHRIAMSYADKCWMRRIINGEPTIIPADKEGEG